MSSRAILRVCVLSVGLMGVGIESSAGIFSSFRNFRSFYNFHTTKSLVPVYKSVYKLPYLQQIWNQKNFQKELEKCSENGFFWGVSHEKKLEFLNNPNFYDDEVLNRIDCAITKYIYDMENGKRPNPKEYLSDIMYQSLLDAFERFIIIMPYEKYKMYVQPSGVVGVPNNNKFSNYICSSNAIVKLSNVNNIDDILNTVGIYKSTDKYGGAVVILVLKKDKIGKYLDKDVEKLVMYIVDGNGEKDNILWKPGTYCGNGDFKKLQGQGVQELKIINSKGFDLTDFDVFLYNENLNDSLFTLKTGFNLLKMIENEKVLEEIDKQIVEELKKKSNLI